MPRDHFLPFSPPSIGEEEIAEVVDTLRSDWITTGPKVKRFEQEFASYVNAPTALAVSSCTDALLIALAALGIGPGDAVFTSTMTFVSTVHVIEHLGATPVLVDIEPDTLNIDTVQLAETVKVTAAEGRLRPAAIIPVHHSGHPCDMDAIGSIAGEHGLAIVEDAAHALPAHYRGQRVGSPRADVPHAVAFSFYATKNLTTGEGGMLTGTPELVEEARLWSLHGMSRDAWNRYGEGGAWFYEVVRPGFKCNMTDIQAALGIHQLQRLGGFQDRRREIVRRYDEGLDDLAEIATPVQRAEADSAWHLYVVRLDLDRLSITRNEVINEMTHAKIGTSVHFIPVHLHPFYRDRYGFEPGDFPVAWNSFNRIVSLPLHPRLTDADVDDVLSALRGIVARARR